MADGAVPTRPPGLTVTARPGTRPPGITGTVPPEAQPSFFWDLLGETGKGMVRGAGTMVGETALALGQHDVAGGSEAFEAYRPDLERVFDMAPDELGAFRQRLAKDHSPDAALVQSLVSDILEGTIRNRDDLNAAVPLPGTGPPMRQRPGYEVWRAIEDWKAANVPAGRNFQSGFGGAYSTVAEGGGTMVPSLLAYLLNPVLGAGVSTLQGEGEALANVYDPARVASIEEWERGQQGVQPGLSAPTPGDVLAGGADQMAGLSAPVGEVAMQREIDERLQADADAAAGIGAAAGLTDILPYSLLTNFVPGGRLVKTGVQGLAEAIQEGPIQQTLQNWAAQQYDPNQSLLEGQIPSAGAGGVLGLLTGGLAEALTPGRGRSGGPSAPTAEQLAAQEALAGRMEPSTGGRQDISLPAAPVVDTTSADVLAADEREKAARAQFPPGDSRIEAAFTDYQNTVAAYLATLDRQRARIEATGPTPARPDVPVGSLPAAVAPTQAVRPEGPPGALPAAPTQGVRPVGPINGLPAARPPTPARPEGPAAGMPAAPTQAVRPEGPPGALPAAPTQAVRPEGPAAGMPAAPTQAVRPEGPAAGMPAAKPGGARPEGPAAGLPAAPKTVPPPEESAPGKPPPEARTKDDEIPSAPPPVPPQETGGARAAVPAPEEEADDPPAAAPPAPTTPSPPTSGQDGVAAPAPEETTSPVSSPVAEPPAISPAEAGGETATAPGEQPAPSAPLSPAPSGTEPTLSPAATEQVNALARRAQTIIDRNVPGADVAAGSEGARQAQKAEAIMSVVRNVRAGMTPNEAAVEAKAEIRKIIAAHNKRRPKDQHWGVDPAAYDREIDHAADMINRPPGAAPTEQPKPKVTPTARKSSQLLAPKGRVAAAAPVPAEDELVQPSPQEPLAEAAAGPRPRRDEEEFVEPGEEPDEDVVEEEDDSVEPDEEPDEDETTEGDFFGEDETDAAIAASDAAQVEIATPTVAQTKLQTRLPRGGPTPTFKKASVATDQPLTERSAYEDAGLDSDEVLASTPADRVNALINLFKSKFGFKAVNREGKYGAANAIDTIDALVDGYRGIRMMMHVLGLPETGGSLDGVISLSIGRKNRFFLGAYDPTDHSIELVGRANSFAHEWAHAFDQWLLAHINVNADNFASRWTRVKGLNADNTIEGHFINVMNAIFFDDAQFATKVLDLQTTAAKLKRDGTPTVAAADAQKQLDDIKAGRGKLYKQRSDYFKKAKNFGRGNPYWTDPAEMMARAFEAYTAFKTELIYPGFKSNFVSKGDAAYLNTADKRLAETFPQAVERARIFSVLDTLVAEVSSRTSLSGTVARAPTENEILDDNAFYVHAAYDAVNAREKEKQRQIVAKLKNRLTQTTSLTGLREMGRDLSDATMARIGPKSRSPLTWEQKLASGFRTVFQSEAANAEIIVNRAQNQEASPYLRAIYDQALEISPGEGRHLPETFPEGVARFTRKYTNRVSEILETHKIPVEVAWGSTSAKTMAEVAQRDRIGDHLISGKKQTGESTDEVAAVASLRRLYDQMHRDATNAGLELGYVEDAGYQPIIPEPFAIHDDEKGFIAAATEGYELVFERAVGITDIDTKALKSAIDEIKHSVHPQVLEDPTIRAAIAKVKKAKGKDAAANADLAELIKPLYGDMRARAWHDAYVKGEYTAMDTRGPQTRHTKGRVLPAEFQTIMADYYVKDPIDAISIYIHAMGRKIEYTRRLGKQSGGNQDFEYLLNRPRSPLLAEMEAKGLDRDVPADRIKAILKLTDPSKDNRLEMLLMEAKRAHALPGDLTRASEQMQFMTGRVKDGGSSYMRPLTDSVYVLGMLSLLPRSTLTSLVEPVTTMMRTGDLKVTGVTLAHYMKEFFAFKGTTVRDIKELTTAMGLISSDAQGAMLSVAMGDHVTGGPRVTKLMSNFFARIGQAGLTKMQKRAGTVGFDLWLRKLLRLAQGTDPGNAAVAKGDLAELGIANDQIQAMHDWLYSETTHFVTPTDLKSEMGQLWEAAGARYANSVIQEGSKGNRPRLTSHPMGQLTFGLTSFMFHFTRNILVRLARKTSRDYRLRREVGEGHTQAYLKTSRDNLLLKGALGFGMIYLGQWLVSVLREAFMNTEQFNRHLEEGDWGEWISALAFSRAGGFGPWDMVAQGVMGVRYQRDLTALTAGPFMNIILSFLQSTANLGYNNSPNTNTAERNWTKEFLRITATPAISAAMASLPGGPLASMIYGGLGMMGTSNTAMGTLVNWIAGEKTEPKGKLKFDLK